MKNSTTSGPSLFERCFAAVFSGLAAGATYAGWLFFHAGHWGADQMASFKVMGKWAVLGGALLGFLGGISLAAIVWGEVWDTRDEPLISLRTALILLVLASIAYAVFRLFA